MRERLKIPAIITAAASVITFAYTDGFGHWDEEAPYRGTDIVPKCDLQTGYKPVPVLGAQSLEESIDRLRDELIKEHGEVADRDDIDPSQEKAVENIFIPDMTWFRTPGPNVIFTGESRMDDSSEVLCYGKSKYDIYLSPEAELAVLGLEEAGIRVDPSLIPEPAK